MNKKILIGTHTSISGGFYKAIEEGEKIGATVIQIFTKSSRSWFGKKILKEDVEKFKSTLKKSNIEMVIAHSSYLINLGSPKKEIEKKSIESLKHELQRCEKLEIPYLIIHPGSHLKTGEKECIKQIAKNLDIVLKEIKGNVQILLETTAGQGTNIGYKFEHIKKIRNLSREKNRIKVCVDTCHIFSAGYNINSPESYKKTFSKFTKIIGLENLKAIHLNDSKTKLNSRKDRHANIGEGELPKKTFELIMNDKHFKNIPKILETPDSKLYAKEIEMLKKMIK